MQEVKPSSHQYRAAGLALILVAVLTTAMISVVVLKLNGPLLLPVFVAYLLFNFGFIFSAVKGRLQTKAARLGLTAVLLNFGAMFLSDFETIWMALSAGAVAVAVLAAFMLLKDARASGP